MLLWVVLVHPLLCWQGSAGMYSRYYNGALVAVTVSRQP